MNKIWFGIVENRTDDPLKLGRVKVRVVGLHTSNKTLLPTEDLPWATPIQPITSAALSGIGTTPTGLVEGSTVIVQFIDVDNQIPIILGSVAGIPNLNSSLANAEEFSVADDSDGTVPPNVVTTESGGILVDSNGEPVTSSSPDGKVLGQLNQQQYDAFKAAVRNKESGNRYNITGGSGGAYAGAYQLGVAALEDLGYIKKGTYAAKGGSASVLNDPINWQNKNGVNNLQAFLNQPAEQELAFDKLTRLNYSRLKGFDPNSVPAEKIAGLLGVAHNQGAGAVTKLLNGNVTTDGFGTSAMMYYSEVGYKSIAGKTTNEFPTTNNIYDSALDKELPANNYDVSKTQAIKSKQIQSQRGFLDPSGRYPLKDHLDEPDTNRLARNQRISRTSVAVREANLIKNIPVANSSVTWHEPPVPYNAKYPFNHVFQSESGHVLEFDDSPAAERINLYHRSGTFKEIEAHGNITEKCQASRATLIEKDDLTYIKGSGHLCIDGDFSILVKRAVNIEVKGDCNLKISGNANTIIEGNKYETVKGSVNQVIKGNYFSKIEGDYELTVDGKQVSVAASTSIRGSDGIALDGKQVHLNSGKTSTAQAPASTEIQFSPSIQQPAPISRQEVLAVQQEETPAAKIAGTQTPVATQEQDMSAAPAKPAPVLGDCSAIPKPYTRSTQLSTNFTLGSLCKDGALPPAAGQRSLTQEQLICNGMHLCLNLLEPLYAKYAARGLVVNSGFRLVKSGTSQHEVFQALDIGFRPSGQKLSKKEYYDIAKEIRDSSIPFDQLLLEYRTVNGLDQYWIHISYNKDNSRKQVLTLLNDRTYAQGLVLLG